METISNLNHQRKPKEPSGVSRDGSTEAKPQRLRTVRRPAMVDKVDHGPQIYGNLPSRRVPHEHLSLLSEPLYQKLEPIIEILDTIGYKNWTNSQTYLTV